MAYTYKLFRLLRMSRINPVPTRWSHDLGGRFDTYPKRRGLTHKELSAESTSHSAKTISRSVEPTGSRQYVHVVHGVVCGALMGYGQIMDSFDM